MARTGTLPPKLLLDTVMAPTQYLVVGANRGIGFELARQLLQNPENRVIATFRDPNKLDDLNSLSLKKENDGRLRLIRMDMGDTKSCKTAAAEVRSTTEHLDVLIVNAGVYIDRTPLLNQDLDEIVGIFGTNVIGPLRICQSFAPLLKGSSTQAKLILMSSDCASLTIGRDEKSASYSISKAALNMLGRKLAYELETSKIAVGLIHPGWVQTDMGGPNARISPQESINGMLKVIDRLDMTNSGGYWIYSGEEHPW
ncbi:hypothetical protein FRC08_013908 [Ceratobasidium sp. 394]|nr:hypothetical protein FRC08_013908 [Ceratobasidium sp. 394]